jgi:hypothetical protein
LVVEKDNVVKPKKERLIDFAFGLFNGKKPRKFEIPDLLDKVKKKFRELDNKEKIELCEIVKDQEAEKKIWSWGAETMKIPTNEEIEQLKKEIEEERILKENEDRQLDFKNKV